MNLSNLIGTVVYYLLIGEIKLVLTIEMGSHGECTSACDAHRIRLTINHDVRLLVFMIH